MIHQIEEAVAYIRSKTKHQARTGIILGTGLSALAKSATIEQQISYRDIPHFVESTVETHDGKLLFGHIESHPVVMMQGRFHFYEGYTMQEITFPVRVLKMLGIERLLISNACGAVNLKFKTPSLMLIDDHINFLPGNPLVGPNNNELGSRFPDMSRPYDVNINTKLKSIAHQLNIPLEEGVYASWIGPNLETRAEYRFLKMAGADVVGMSTVPEVIVANHAKLPVAAISVITDLCDPDNLQETKLSDILRNAALAEKSLSKLISAYLKSLN